MTDKPLTKSDIQALACADCPAAVSVLPSLSGVTGKPVPVVTVQHAECCPWAVRHIPASVRIVAGPPGVLLHCAHETEPDDLTFTMPGDLTDPGPSTDDTPA